MLEAESQPAASPESPSLFTAGDDGPPAFEMKFLLTEEVAREVEGRVRQHLSLDSHANPELGNAYLTTSVYTDTPAFDIFHRTGAIGRDKYRARSYGTGGLIFLERKTRTGDRVRKLRSLAPEGDWFRHEVDARKLQPVCRVSYERVAFTGLAGGGAVRVTFDRNVRGTRASGWAVDPVGPAPVLLDGRVICEFKFRHALPGLFKDIIHALALSPSTVSKYRLFMQTAGLPGVEGASDA